MALTHYDVLNVTRSASRSDVQAAFRLRAHMFHPDKYENYEEPLRSQLMAEAGKEFKRLRRAYEVLSSTDNRQDYDRSLRSKSRQSSSKRKQADGKEPGVGSKHRGQNPRPSAVNASSAGSHRSEPLLIVSPASLDFGLMVPGNRRQLGLRISNGGGRTLFGEITTNRAWLAVNRHSFISSSTLAIVSVDTSNLQGGKDYWGNLVVSTLNGGDRVVRVVVGVSEPTQPIMAGVPDVLDFGTAVPGQVKSRTVRPRNVGTGHLTGNVGSSSRWLSSSQRHFEGDDVPIEIIANATDLRPGERFAGQIQIDSNGGTATTTATILVEDPSKRNIPQGSK